MDTRVKLSRSCLRRGVAGVPFCVPLCAVLTTACGEPVVLGSDILWSTDHESGTLDDWSSEQRGGAYPGPREGSAIEITSERARSGGYSVKLTRPGIGADGGPLLFREIEASRAYYSAWYYVPSAPPAISYWTISQIRALPADDPDQAPHGINLNLRVLPGDEIVLLVFENDEAGLQAPLADPPAFVPVGRWFQLEFAYEPEDGAPGRLTVWLEGTRVYDVGTAPLIGEAGAYFMPCNVAKQLGSEPVEIFVDDVAVSRVRVSPEGILTLK
jgi:hypothetical protein